MKRSSYQTVEEYLSDIPQETREILKRVRATIKSQLPEEALETISYQIPTFKLNGKYVIYFAGFKNHISVYPIPNAPESFMKKIAPYVKGKGTISFLLTDPIPMDLIAEITKYALETNLKRTKK